MRTEGQIAVASEGVTVRDRQGHLASFEWNAVTRILLYKVDLLTTDCVCLEFQLGDDRSIIVNEEVPGWKGLAPQLARHFSVRTACFDDVIQPPFATNMSILWDQRVDQAWECLVPSRVADLWRSAQGDFVRDGALRDIYIADTTLKDWNTILAAARGMFGPVEASSRSRMLKHDLAEKHFKGRARASLSLAVGESTLHGYCFTLSPIELSFSPASIASSSQLHEILRVVISATVLLNRSAVIAPENAPQLPIFQISASGDVRFVPASAGLTPRST